jgi:hypothetical protein
VNEIPGVKPGFVSRGKNLDEIPRDFFIAALIFRIRARQILRNFAILMVLAVGLVLADGDASSLSHTQSQVSRRARVQGPQRGSVMALRASFS